MKQKPVLTAFIGRGQAACIRSLLRGEEGAWYRERVAALQAVVDAMPTTYETDGQGDAAVARLHYMWGSVDAWVTELDMGAKGDTDADYQRQAFGMVDLGYGPELGYINIPELLANGLEVDLTWVPKAIGEIRAQKGL